MPGIPCLDFNWRTRPATVACAFTACLTIMANAASAQSFFTGTATYRERMTLPAGAVLEVTLEDVSRADAPAETIAATRVESPGPPPISFKLVYDQRRIVSNRRYVVRARIVAGGELLFTTDTAVPVRSANAASPVALMLRRVSGRPAAPLPAGLSLVGTYWRAIELAGKPVPTTPANREAHLLFATGGRVGGADGCNRINGGYELTGDRMTFRQIAATQMACLNPPGTERPFRDALAAAARFTITGDRLELFDGDGVRRAYWRLRRRVPPVSPVTICRAHRGDWSGSREAMARCWRRTIARGTPSSSTPKEVSRRASIATGAAGPGRPAARTRSGSGRWP